MTKKKKKVNHVEKKGRYQHWFFILSVICDIPGNGNIMLLLGGMVESFCVEFAYSSCACNVHIL